MTDGVDSGQTHVCHFFGDATLQVQDRVNYCELTREDALKVALELLLGLGL